MNLKKRALALCLGVAMMLSLAVSASAAGFSDIHDAETAQNVEILQMMNVINGVSAYSFQPEGTLTRAQFTKMAVMALGKGSEVAGYQSFTIFPDVKSSHWAAGYINLAVRGDTKFIAGYSDGRFGPEQSITFGQAVTILMRLLGYTDQDVGQVCPTGYINAAASAGLTDGVKLSAESSITRAQAAKLFVNLLGCKTKDGKTSFSGLVASTLEEDVVLLDAAAKANDGSAAIETTDGVYKLENGYAPLMLQGRRGDLLLNAKGEAWGFVPSRVGSVKDITVSSARAGKITDTQGIEYTLTADTVAYYDGEKTTYGEVFINLRSGAFVTLHFGSSGKVESLFVGGSAVETAMVVGGKITASGLSLITGGRTDYEIIRQGEVVTPSQLKTYDVATYHPTEGKVYVSTLRLSGYYQSAYPNAEAPTTLKLLGRDFTVLPSAISTLSQFKVGESVTLLLTHDFQVAGALKPQTLSGNAIGIASLDGSKATVELLEGISVSGKITSNNAASFDGLLVKVSSYKADQISLVPLGENTRTGSLDVAAGTYGDYSLASGVKIFERVGRSAMAEITLDEIRMDKVLRTNIQYSRVNDQGRVDLLILDNVTGDRFVYGRATSVRVEEYDYHMPTEDPDGKDTTKEPDINDKWVLTLQSGEKKFGPFFEETFRTGQWAGLALNNTQDKLVSSVKLKELRNVSNENFLNKDTVRIGDTVYTVSEEVVCYNRTTGLWTSIESARAFGGEMKLYVDDFLVVRGVEVG